MLQTGAGLSTSAFSSKSAPSVPICVQLRAVSDLGGKCRTARATAPHRRSPDPQYVVLLNERPERGSCKTLVCRPSFAHIFQLRSASPTFGRLRVELWRKWGQHCGPTVPFGQHRPQLPGIHHMLVKFEDVGPHWTNIERNRLELDQS